MKKSDNDLSTSLGKARGLGAAHHGVMHWWYQRLTAVALIPLLLWFVYSLVSALLVPDVGALYKWFASPCHALLLSLLLVVIFAHAKLGLQVIIEDYVHGPAKKYTLLIGNIFICYGAAALAVLSIIKLHLFVN